MFTKTFFRNIAIFGVIILVSVVALVSIQDEDLAQEQQTAHLEDEA